MLAVSANGALGNAGLLLVLAASCLGALSTGFLLTVALSWTVDSPGDWVERLLPLAAALALALTGSRKRL